MKSRDFLVPALAGTECLLLIQILYIPGQERRGLGAGGAALWAEGAIPESIEDPVFYGPADRIPGITADA